ERAEEREVVVGPELRTRLAADNLELPNALKGQRFVLLPAITGRDLLRQVLREIGGVAAEEHGPTLGQLDEKGHVAGGMARREKRADAGSDVVVSRLETPGVLSRELVGEDPVVEASGEGGELGLMHVHVATRQLAESSRVIEVQVAEDDHVDVVRSEAEAAEIARDPLRLGHARRLEPRPHGIEVARLQLGSGDLAIVAAGVVEDAAVWRLDEVGENGRVDVLTVTAMARRHDLLVADGPRQQWPQAKSSTHARLRSWKLVSGGEGEANVEDRASVRPTRHGDASALGLGHDAADREAEPGARHVGSPGRAAAIEALEEVGDLLLRHPGACVGDRHNRGVSVRHRVDAN